MKKAGIARRMGKDLRVNYDAYLLILPVIAFYILFCYKPMYGAVIAFKDFSPVKGILGSPWVGLKHFESFFASFHFKRVFSNTITISLATLIFGFPAPILLALLINELTSRRFARVVQTISYLPHFISLVVICSMIRTFVAEDGIINYIRQLFGAAPVNLLSRPEYFVPIYVLSNIWEGVGWGSIIYLAAITGIDMELYEAAKIDGANRWRQTLHVTLPGIIPTIIILFILRMGSVMNVGFEKIILLYNSLIYDTADVISSFTYRKGLLEQNWSFSTAVGLFNSVINFAFVITFNQISKKISEISLW